MVNLHSCLSANSHFTHSVSDGPTAAAFPPTEQSVKEDISPLAAATSAQKNTFRGWGGGGGGHSMWGPTATAALSQTDIIPQKYCKLTLGVISFSAVVSSANAAPSILVCEVVLTLRFLCC